MADKIHPEFAGYVTSTAFNLSLSKTMIVELVTIANKSRGRYDIHRVIFNFDHSISASNALHRRGLIYAPNPKYPGLFELTEPGKHVLELLKMAGLVQHIQETLESVDEGR